MQPVLNKFGQKFQERSAYKAAIIQPIKTNNNSRVPNRKLISNNRMWRVNSLQARGYLRPCANFLTRRAGTECLPWTATLDCRRGATIASFHRLLLPSSHSSSPAAPPENLGNLTQPQVTSTQLKQHFMMSCVPMIGFGFVDQTIMIQAGHALDCTLGVSFGLSTLTAAACGQIVSNGAGVIFGGSLEHFARAAGLPSPGFSSRQRALPRVRKVGVLANFVGVIVGCTLGLVNLLFIDHEKTPTLKLRALVDGEKEVMGEFEFELSNSLRPDATTLTIRGPDVDGMLASLTSSLTEAGCSVVELHAGPRGDYQSLDRLGLRRSSSGHVVEDVFVVRDMNTKMAFEEEQLEPLGRRISNALKNPLSMHSLKLQVQELKAANDSFAQRSNE